MQCVNILSRDSLDGWRLRVFDVAKQRSSSLSASICRLSSVYYNSQSISWSSTWQKGFKATSCWKHFVTKHRIRSCLTASMGFFWIWDYRQVLFSLDSFTRMCVCEATHNNPSKGGRAAAQIKGDAWQRADNKQPHSRGAAPGQSWRTVEGRLAKITKATFPLCMRNVCETARRCCFSPRRGVCACVCGGVLVPLYYCGIWVIEFLMVFVPFFSLNALATGN